MISNDMDKRMDFASKEFFKDIGIRENQIILDFGCGHDTYIIPSALVVGEIGRVYIVDKNRDALKKLRYGKGT